MPKIVISQFKGTLPLVSPRLLPDGYGQTATNVDLNQDSIMPLATYDSTLALSGSALRKFFKIKTPTDSFWITSTSVIDICLSPSSWLATEYARFYWTDGVIPKKSNFDMASVSGTLTNGSIAESYFAGVPAPPSALTAALVNAGDGVIHTTANYVYTYVTAWGEESMPSMPSNTVDVCGGQYVTLSGFTFNVASLTRRGIVGVKIYRINTSSAGNAEYQVITSLNDSTAGVYKKIMDWNTGTGTIAISGSTITGVGTNFDPQIAVNDWILCKGQWFKIATRTSDTAATTTYPASPTISAGAAFYYDTQPWTTVNDHDGANEIYDAALLGDIIPSEEWDEPEDDMQGLMLLANNCMAGYKHNEIWISEPGYPFTYPSAYQIKLMSDIIGMGFYGTTIVAFTRERPCIIEAYDPANLSKTYIPEYQAPLWRRSIVSGNGFVLFASPDGLMAASTSDSTNSITNLTEKIFTKSQWQTLLTTSTAYDKEIIGCLYDNKYIAFFIGTEHGFMIDLKTNDYRNFSLPNTIDVWDTFVDSDTDSLFLLADVSGAPYVIKWAGHATNKLTYTYKSKKYYFPKKVKISIGKILITSGDTVTLKVYGDGVQMGGDITISSSSPFRYGSLGTALAPSYEWEYELTGTKPVSPPAVFATTMGELLS